MKILFVHQNMPGQYREMIRWLRAQGGHELTFLTQRNGPDIEGVRRITYAPWKIQTPSDFGLTKPWEESLSFGFAAAQAAEKLKSEGYRPDIVLGHVGWGELTFFKEVWPDVPIIGYFEYFYRTEGGMVGFDPEEKVSAHAGYFAKARNVTPTMNIETVDLGLSPTYWQRDRFPESFHDRMYVCHDGIRTDLLTPDPTASVKLGRLETPLTSEDEVVTYVARNMERARGFHVMMRALPEILDARPNARVLMIGGNQSSYGEEVREEGGLRGVMERELGHRVDWNRVHFLGRVPYPMFQKIIQISRCHIYLTMPFVLSWSLLESMSMGARIVASDVAPVREAITHGKTGMLVDFFKPDALAAQVVDVLSRPDEFAGMGQAARSHVVETYDFLTRCMPEHARRMNDLVPPELKLAV